MMEETSEEHPVKTREEIQVGTTNIFHLTTPFIEVHYHGTTADKGTHYSISPRYFLAPFQASLSYPGIRCGSVVSLTVEVILSTPRRPR